MNKKIYIGALLIVIVVLIISNQKSFKKEYEKLNNKNYIKVTIPKDNPVVYINNKKLRKIVKTSSVIFIGSYKNQASRDSIKPLLKAADDTGIDKIYYIDINQIKNKKILKRKITKIPALIIIKKGKIIDYVINDSKNDKMTTKEKTKLEEKYKNAINKTLICNTSEDTC